MKFKSIWNTKGTPIVYDIPNPTIVFKEGDFTVIKQHNEWYDYLYRDVCFAQRAGFTLETVGHRLDCAIIGLDKESGWMVDNLNKAINLVHYGSVDAVAPTD